MRINSALPCRLGDAGPNFWGRLGGSRTHVPLSTVRTRASLPGLRFPAALSAELPGLTQRGRDSNPHMSRVKAGRLYLFVHRAKGRAPTRDRTWDLRRVKATLYATELPERERVWESNPT